MSNIVVRMCTEPRADSLKGTVWLSFISRTRKNISGFFVHTMKVNVVKCCFWISLTFTLWTKTVFKIFISTYKESCTVLERHEEIKMTEFRFFNIATSHLHIFFVKYCTFKHSSPLIYHFCRDFLEISMFVIHFDQTNVILTSKFLYFANPTLLFSMIFDLSHLFHKERHLLSCLNQFCMTVCCDNSKWQVFLWALHPQNSMQRPGYRHTPVGLAAPKSNV